MSYTQPRKGIKHYCVPWATGDETAPTALRAPYTCEQAHTECAEIRDNYGLPANVVEHTDMGAAVEYLLRAKDHFTPAQWEEFKLATYSNNVDVLLRQLYEPQKEDKS